MVSDEVSTTFRETALLDDVQQKVLATVLGVASKTITARKDIFTRLPGKRGRYDLIASVQAYLSWVKGDGKMGAVQGERGRLYEQQRRKLELQNDQESRGLVKVDDAAALLAEVSSALRAGLTALPGRLAAQLAVLSKPAECRRLVAHETEDLLTDFQTFLSERYPQAVEQTVPDSEGGDTDSKAKPKPKRRRVGRPKSKATTRKRGARKVAK